MTIQNLTVFLGNELHTTASNTFVSPIVTVTGDQVKEVNHEMEDW